MALSFVRFDVHQPDDRSNAQLTEIWNRESQAAVGLPIVVEMGGAVDTECLAIYPYEDFADDLAKAVSG